MKMNGKVVTYEMFVARNNQMKALLRQTGGMDRVVRVSMLETATNGNYKAVRVWLDNNKTMKAGELIYAVMNGNGAISNPSIFDGWGGWNYEEKVTTSPRFQALAVRLPERRQGTVIIGGAGAPVPIEFCVPKLLPSFVPKASVRRVDGGFEYQTGAQGADTKFAKFYEGVWIQDGRGGFQYIDADSLDAEMYCVVGRTGRRCGNIKSFVELCQKKLGNPI